MIPLAVLLAGALGACLRHAVDRAVQPWASARLGPFPLGILVVNASGCLLLGLVAGAAEAGTLTSSTETVLAIGLLGSYTTFSTYAFDTVELARRGAWRPALGNGAGSLLLGFLACAAGLAVGLHL